MGTQPMARFGSLLRSAGTYPRPMPTMISIESLPPLETVATCWFGLSTLMPAIASVLMSPASTAPGPSFTRLSV